MTYDLDTLGRYLSPAESHEWHMFEVFLETHNTTRVHTSPISNTLFEFWIETQWNTDADRALRTLGWRYWDQQCQTWPPDQDGFLYWLPHKPVDNAAQEPPTSQRLLMDTAGWGLCSGHTQIHKIVVLCMDALCDFSMLLLTFISMKRCMASTHSNSITLDWKAPHKYLWPEYGFRTIHTHTEACFIFDCIYNKNNVLFYVQILKTMQCSDHTIWKAFQHKTQDCQKHASAFVLTYTTFLTTPRIWYFIGHSKLPERKAITWQH